MPYYAKSEDWLHQSALLLQARPSTTRITTRYHLKPARRTPKPPKSADTTTTAAAAAATTTTTQQPQEKEQTQNSKPPRGHLVLKTFDPSSGVTLKYKTSKAAEVTRLVQMLGALGKRMAGVVTAAPEKVGAAGDDVVMADAAGAAAAEGGEGLAAGSGSGVQTPVAGAGAGAGQQGQQGQQQAGGGGKGKKKKGKR
ncbi:hypothetical protein NEMBOFW57_000244 [Staphylotrichum longicolle]|uniref:SRP9 domain-containing protein n=1 Tax=Staphylotrichum longicolle TaxID=669026 RepID=A0AAD4EZ13_9PEZI|nr:hypothetical protein NEMBOFW57_000244 [Staphylotrichum longicolle]